MAITPFSTGDIILSIREQIPDRTAGDDPSLDGKAFTLNALLRWINDAGRQMCMQAPVIQDWYGVQSVTGLDLYTLPQYISSVEQVWYDLLPLTRSPEADSLFSSKITGRSWWFGPHVIHATPRLFMWPACDRTGGTTTLNGSITATQTTLTLSAANISNQYGFAILGTGANAELIRYATISGTAVSNITRGQGGTTAQAWSNGSAVTEANIFFKCFRLPTPLTKATDVMEVPAGLWPLIELYVLAKVREAEQDHQTAQGMLQAFGQEVEKMSTKGGVKGLRQGIQIKLDQPYPSLFMGRIYVP